MSKKHPKSACCRAQIIRYGGKRRQCVFCRRTWTVRPKRRGRKRFRAAASLIDRYFSGSISSVRSLAKHNDWNRDRAQQMVKRSLARYVARHGDDWRSSLPKNGKLLAVADAMWHHIGRRRITVFIILIRPLDQNEAIIMPPSFWPEHEDGQGWEYAWQQVPYAHRRRICALVCDGQRWLVDFGRRQDWIVQRCQFHLLANLQMYLGAKDRDRNSRVIKLVRALFSTATQRQSQRILNQLAKIRIMSKSRGIRRVLSGLATNHMDFQSYLRYPEMNLPITTNAAESCIKGVRELMRRCRGFRSLETLKLWTIGYVSWKKTIRCGGKNQQN